MDDTHGTLSVYASDDGVVVLGEQGLLADLDAVAGLKARAVPQRALNTLAGVLQVGSQVQANSGRWLKMDDKTMKYLQDNGVTDVVSGVVRRKNISSVAKGGQITKHLTFEKAALVTPAGSAVAASMVTQAAIEAALEDITEYLEVIDAKLDRLLKQRRVEVLGQLGGVTLAIDEANAIHAETGTVSAVTWSKVQANSLALQTMQAETIAQLQEIADEITKQRGKTDDSAEAISKAQEDVPFWLGVLARTLALQDRQYVLELARVADSEPDQLESHRQGIRVARAQRARKIAASLDAIRTSIREGGQLTNFERVANPFSTQRITRGANSVNEDVGNFATHVDLELSDLDRLSHLSWGRAAKALAGESAAKVGTAGADAAGKAKSLAARMQEKREASLIKKADKIREKHRVIEGASEDVEGDA